MFSCVKVEDIEQGVIPVDNGVVRLSIATPKEVTEGYNPMENCTIRIYKYTDSTDAEGQPTRIKELIRLYKSTDAVPAQLALLAGDYAVRVDVGTKAEASFTELSYRGEADFMVEAGIITPVAVECKLQNSVVAVVFDPSIAQKLNLEAYADVCIGEAYDAAGIKSGKVSESKLIIVRPFKLLRSIPTAPSIPVSSSTVRITSIGGWGMVLSASNAIAIATAIPLSPPKVVPLAKT